jgi:anti-anti-sigma regulatory factor
VLNTTTVGYRAVLALAGPVNAFTVDGLERALERVVSSSARDVWIDLTDVTFLHAGAAAVLTDAAARLELRNRRLAVIAPPGPARTRLRLTGADRRLEVCANRVEAHRAG